MTVGMVNTSFDPNGEEGQVMASEGDQLEVRFDYGDGWCEVIGANGEGIFPTAYLDFPHGNPPMGPPEDEDDDPFPDQMAASSQELHAANDAQNEAEMRALAMQKAEADRIVAEKEREAAAAAQQLESERIAREQLLAESDHVRSALEKERQQRLDLEAAIAQKEAESNAELARKQKETEEAAEERLRGVLAEKERLAHDAERQKKEFEERERELALSREEQSQKRAQQFMQEREKSSQLAQQLEQLQISLQHAQAQQREYERLLEAERMENAVAKSSLEEELKKERDNTAQLLEDTFSNSKKEKDALEERVREMREEFEKKEREEVLKREEQSAKRAVMFQQQLEKGSALQQQYEAEKAAHAQAIESIKRQAEAKVAQMHQEIVKMQQQQEQQRTVIQAQMESQINANRMADRKKLEETLMAKKVEYEAQKAADLQAISDAKAEAVAAKGAKERVENALLKEKQAAEIQRDQIQQAYQTQIGAISAELQKSRQALASREALEKEHENQLAAAQGNLQKMQNQTAAMAQQIQGQNTVIGNLSKQNEDMRRAYAQMQQDLAAARQERDVAVQTAEAEKEARKNFEAAANAKINQQLQQAAMQQQMAQQQQAALYQERMKMENEKQQLQAQHAQLKNQQEQLSNQQRIAQQQAAQQQAQLQAQQRAAEQQRQAAQQAAQQQAAQQQAQFMAQQRAAEQQRLAEQQKMEQQRQAQQRAMQQQQAAQRAAQQQLPMATPGTWKPAQAYGNTYATPAPLNLPERQAALSGGVPQRSAPPVHGTAPVRAAPGQYQQYQQPPGVTRPPPPLAPTNQQDPFANLQYQS